MQTNLIYCLDSRDGRIQPTFLKTENSESFSFYLPRDKKLEKGAKLEVSPYSQVRKTLFYCQTLFTLVQSYSDHVLDKSEI